MNSNDTVNHLPALNENLDENQSNWNDLRSYKINNVNNLVVASININSIRNKFDQLKLLVNDNVDILIVEETKIDETFPTGQFIMDGYMPPFRKDRNQYGGGLLIYVKDNIPAKLVENYKMPTDIESIFIELNFRRNKWLLMGTYHPPSQCTKYFYTEVGKALDCYMDTYDNILLLGDFNEKVSETNTKNFMEIYDLNNLVKEPTCYKNPLNPSCIDLILTNKSRNFKNTTTIDFGLSDFHKMIITSFKFQYKPGNPKIVYYRQYKHFDRREFENELKQTFMNYSINSYDAFEDKFLELLEKHAPLKKKTLRANDAPYMTKTLRKAMMKRTELANKYDKTRNLEDYTKFRKHRNYVNKLYKRERRNYFNSLDKNDVQNVKLFWKTWKPVISDNYRTKNKITLVKGKDIISDGNIIAQEFKNEYSNAVKNLNIEFEWQPTSDLSQIEDPIDKVIEKFKDHPSILKIKERVEVLQQFEITKVSEEHILDLIAELDTKKATTFNNIPGKFLKEYSQTYYKTLTKLVNQSIEECTFPDKLKLADVFPIYKKDDRNTAKNYRPVSVLPYVSKLYERIMKEQIQISIDSLLSVNLCGYRKGFSAQHALISMTEKWRKIMDQKGFAGAILMDLSKAFDCLDHDLLIAKLNAYGFNNDALKSIQSYLTNRWQRVKVENYFSNWFELDLGVPQGSVLGPLLFNIYLNDLLWFTEDCEVCNFADDTTIFACNKNIDEIKEILEKSADIAIEWFKTNYFKLNTDKCKLIVGGHKSHSISVRVGNSTINEENMVKLLGIKIDNKLKFDDHISKLVKKANSKLFVIRRGLSMLTLSKRKILLNSFVQSQFSYAPLVWMLCSKTANKKINRVHYKFLKMLHDDENSTYEQLLNKYNEFSVHQRNIQNLMVEMYKVKNDLGPSLLNNIFHKSNYKGPTLRSSKDFHRPTINTLKYGEKSLENIGNINWNLLPQELKQLKTLDEFKLAIKQWKNDKCKCYLCKDFLTGVGIVEFCDCANC